jgi:hypothetical protein
MTEVWVAIGVIAAAVLIGQAVKSYVDRHVRRAMEAQRSRDAAFDRHAGQALAVANSDWTPLDELQARRAMREGK